MSIDSLLDDIAALPPDKREEVADFVAFLRSRSNPGHMGGHEVVQEPTDFVGMWADRSDMADSAAWVRRLRERQWGSLNG